MTLHDEETRLVNPCKKFLKFSGETLSYYDKEKGENVEVKTPVEFVSLIELKAMSGFDEKHSCGIFSNEVEKLGDQLMKVVSFKGGDIVCGLYGDIKDRAKAAGARFTASVYALMDGELVNFQLRGAALKGWIDKKPGTKFKVASFEEGKKGSVKFSIPVFEPIAFKSDKEKKEARVALDDLMVNYLSKYWAQKQEELQVYSNNPINSDEVVRNNGLTDAEVRAMKKQVREDGKKDPDELREQILKDAPTEDNLPF